MLSWGVRVHEPGGPAALTYESFDVPPPGAGEVQIDQRAIGLNFIDTHHRTGRYASETMPIVPGIEGAGVVLAVGEGPEGFNPGQRVAYVGGPPGAYSVIRNIPAWRVVHLPDNIDFDVASALMLKGMTAQYLLTSAYPAQAGETVLFHAAAGGVGQIFCQLASAGGVRVIGTVGSREKMDIARAAGCAEVICYSSEDFPSRVREITAGEGVAAVYDAVGAETFEGSLSSLRVRGMLVSFGSASGPVPPLDLFRLNRMGSLGVTSASLRHYTADRDELLQRVRYLFDALTASRLRVEISHRFALRDARTAHQELEARRTSGCAVLVP